MKTITRPRLAGLTGAATALTLIATLSPASPVYAAAVSSAVQKSAALEAVGMERDPILIGSTDCNFVIGVWRGLEGREFHDEIRAAAVAAFSSPTAAQGDLTDCTNFILTEVYDAKRRDLAIEVRVKDERRAELELKKKAALTIGITADVEMLALDVRGFVDEIRKRATGADVRAAALAAYDGTDEDRTAFLTTGIVEAYKRDRLREIEIEAGQDAARRQKLIEDAARGRAMAVLLQAVTPGMLAANDRDFISYIWEIAPQNGEISAAANSAVLSREPADWNAFIHTGIHEARERQRQIDLRRKFEADVAEAQDVLTAATAGGFQVLAQAAKKALAGSAEELSRFLRVGQYDLELQTGFEPGTVTLNWATSPAWSTAVQNVNGCSVAETSSTKAAVVKANAELADAKAWLAEAVNRIAQESDPIVKALLASALRLEERKARVATATAAKTTADTAAAACAAKQPQLVIATPEQDQSRGRAVRYFGVDHSITKSHAYFRAIALSQIVVKPTTKLTYWIRPESNTIVSHVVGANSTCAAVDLTFNGGGTLRDSGATDDRGYRAHPAYQCGHLTLNQWNKVTVPLGARFNGQAITGLAIGYDQAAGTGGFRGYVDDVSITH